MWQVGLNFMLIASMYFGSNFCKYSEVVYPAKFKNMKIACIGWGSLIWNPGNLEIQNTWFKDGPFLPIEFARRSKDGRMTLIIDNSAAPVRTLWALMTTRTLSESVKSLKEREGTSTANIHHVSKTDIPTDQIRTAIKQWLVSKDLDAAIWTGLSYKDVGIRPTIEDVITQILSLDYVAGKAAEEYIRKAPKQIDTEYRRAIEQQLGWTPIE